jgi:hypothetical protein
MLSSFMPIWGRLQDLLRFIADELRQRQIVLFDHRSSRDDKNRVLDPSGISRYFVLECLV